MHDHLILFTDITNVIGVLTHAALSLLTEYTQTCLVDLLNLRQSKLFQTTL